MLVLGIGNLVMTDDGVGVRVVRRLEAEYAFPPEVTVLDGGTLGLDLLPRLEGVERLLIVDAVETGSPPGTPARMTGEEIHAVFEARLSLHQTGLKDLLALSSLLGITPPEMVLLGVQPESIGMGTDLSPAVEARLDDLVAGVVRELARWGVEARPLSE